MKKIFIVLAVLTLMVVLVGCGGNNAAPEVAEQTPIQDSGAQVAEAEQEASSLVGVWNWEGMAEAIILETDGGYSWLGVDYGALGYRWTSNNGVVSSSTGIITIEWFTYRFIDDNTIEIEYSSTPGITYILQRSAN